MLSWVKSLFDSSAVPGSNSETQSVGPSNAARASAVFPVTYETVLSDLCQWISANSDLGLSSNQLDANLHIYDCGYVDSIRAAELLAHIQTTYQLLIPEADLVGDLFSLNAIAREICSRAEVGRI